MSPADQQMIPQALQLMKDSPLRSFRIQVAADSLVQLDENQNKQDRVEFMTAFSNFLREAVPAGQASPEMVPMLMDVMKFGIGGFKQAQTIEGSIDAALQQMVQASAQKAQNPQPSPEMMKIQAQQQTEQAKVQADVQSQQARAQAEMQIEQMKAQMEAQMESQRQQHEAQLKMQELAAREQFDRWKAELEAATKIMVARIGSDPAMDFPETEAVKSSAEQIMEAMGAKVDAVVDHVSQSNAAMSDMHNRTMDALTAVAKNITAPRRIVRGADGRAVGVEPVQMGQ
jgi:flagellar biosynthesis GTPase FlhF